MTGAFAKHYMRYLRIESGAFILDPMESFSIPGQKPDKYPVSEQVWSLTQFYSVDFSQLRISVKKCVFYKRTIKVCVSCCWRCPGTSALSAAHLTVSMCLCSSGSNARGEGPRRAPCQLKKPFEGPRWRRGSCWEERKRIVFPRWGVIDLPFRQINEFLKKEKRKKLS